MKVTGILLLFCFSFLTSFQNLPKGFVYLETIDTSIKKELKYFSHQNFIGKPINGYQKNVLIVTEKAALALHRIQQIVLKEGYSLKIFDAYRPQQAVDHFVKWASVLEDTLMKQKYYPRIPKSKLFQLGYIASKSGHSRGSTVDLTLVNIETNQELDMGSPYDFFGNESHPHYKKNSRAQLANRLFLRKVMLENGFKPYENEWWHFTLLKEPFPTTYFNFPVK